MKPVNPPRNQPLCFPFPPEINPPANRVINDTMVMTYCKEDSCREVNLSSKENRMLLVIKRIKIAINPYKIALPTCLLSSIVNLSFPSHLKSSIKVF